MYLEFFGQYNEIAMFLLRLVVAVIFIPSGLGHLKDPAGRAKSIGLPKSFTIFIGLAELLGGVALIIGFLEHWAALGLIIIMLGAIWKKSLVWKTGFWGEHNNGWHYEVMIVVMNLVILTSI